MPILFFNDIVLFLLYETITFPFIKKFTLPKKSYIFDVKDGMSGYMSRCEKAEPYITQEMMNAVNTEKHPYKIVDLETRVKYSEL